MRNNTHGLAALSSIACACVAFATDMVPAKPAAEPAAAQNPIKALALAQADAETVLVELRQIVMDDSQIKGRLEPLFAVCNDASDAVRRARQAEDAKGDARSQAVLAACDADEKTIAAMTQNVEPSARRIEMDWAKAREKFGAIYDAFNRVAQTAESWKRAQLDHTRVVALFDVISDATVSLKGSVNATIEQAKGLQADIQQKAAEIKKKYSQP